MERNVHQLGIISTEQEDWNHVTTVLRKGKKREGEGNQRERESTIVIPFIYRLLRVDIMSLANWTKQLCKALLLVNKSLSRGRKCMYKSSVLVADMFH